MLYNRGVQWDAICRNKLNKLTNHTRTSTSISNLLETADDSISLKTNTLLNVFNAESHQYKINFGQ